MYISQLHIQNYRGVESETLHFDRFNTLIGRNDCGKSTIVNAIRLFFNDEKVSQKDFNFYATDEKNISITVTLSDYDIEDLKNFLVGGEKEDGFTYVIQDYVIEGSLVIKKVWAFKDSGEASSVTYVQINNFVTNKIYGIKTAELKKLGKELKAEPPVDGTGNNSDLERRYYLREKLIELGESRVLEFIETKHSEIKDSLPSIELFKADQSIETTTTEFKGTFSTEIKTIIKAEKDSGSSSTLAAIEEKISKKIEEESEVIKKCMTEHISDLSNLLITPSFSWEKGVEITNVEIQLKGDQKPIPLENKGSGYRRLFMVGRLRYLADKKQSENVIYLVEEPETFLHPSAQDEMLRSLISLSDSNQIFITTHSPIFTGATNQNAITLCKKEDTKLRYEQRNDDGFLLDIASQLGVKPSHNILDSYEVIVFVEGSNDREFLKIASQKLSKELHTLEQSGKVAIIEGGGGSLSNFIDIKYFEKQGKNMFLIIDSDNFDDTQITNPKTQEGLKRQQTRNAELKTKFESKPKAKCFILKKKNIDTYYHPKAVERKTGITISYELFPDNFCTKVYFDELRQNNQGATIPSKNWIGLFNEMSNDEWKAVSGNELESVLDEIAQVIQN